MRSFILNELFYFTDYEKVLELDPNNFEATNELRKINCVSLNCYFWGMIYYSCNIIIKNYKDQFIKS